MGKSQMGWGERQGPFIRSSDKRKWFAFYLRLTRFNHSDNSRYEDAPAEEVSPNTGHCSCHVIRVDARVSTDCSYSRVWELS